MFVFSCEAQVETAEPPGHIRSPQNVHLSQTSGAQGGSRAALDGLPSFLPVLFLSLHLLQHAYASVCIFFFVRRAEHNQVRAAPLPYLRPSAAFTPFHPSVGASQKVPRAPVLTFPRSLSLASHSTPNASFPFFTKPLSKRGHHVPVLQGCGCQLATMYHGKLLLVCSSGTESTW